MLLPWRPSRARLRAFRAAQAGRPWRYRAVGATRATPPPGYRIDHNRVRLGRGAATWGRAVAAVRRWEMFHLGWATVYPPRPPIAVGATVVVVARHLGFWSASAARIVYTVDEAGPPRRFGFAYGTLPGHVERGEERFTVEWQAGDNSVWYDILAFSRPQQPWVWLGYPFARLLQRRFARDSKRAMVRAVATAPPGSDPA